MVMAAATAVPITISAIFQGSRCRILMAGWWILKKKNGERDKYLRDAFQLKTNKQNHKVQMLKFSPLVSADSSLSD